MILNAQSRRKNKNKPKVTQQFQRTFTIQNGPWGEKKEIEHNLHRYCVDVPRFSNFFTVFAVIEKRPPRR